MQARPVNGNRTHVPLRMVLLFLMAMFFGSTLLALLRLPSSSHIEPQHRPATSFQEPPAEAAAHVIPRKLPPRKAVAEAVAVSVEPSAGGVKREVATQRRKRPEDLNQRPILCPDAKPAGPFQHDRDYRTQPIRLSHACPFPCDIGCKKQSSPEACFDHTCAGSGYRVVQNMESVVNYPSLKYEAIKAGQGSKTIVATYELDADVPSPYFSWFIFNLLKEPKPKTADALAIGFISNCAKHNNRLEYLHKLPSFGVSVHAYGRCAQVSGPKLPSGSRDAVKMEALSTHKFTLSMENSNCPYYVTEKLYHALESGSVPIHMGTNDVKGMAPEHSIISVHDFDSMKEVADYLLELDKNETAYQEYLAWKDAPLFDDRFKAFGDLTIVHSCCRLCIRMADIQVAEKGDVVSPFDADDLERAKRAPCGTAAIRVRERNTFYWLKLYLEEYTLDELMHHILYYVPWKPVPPPYGSPKQTDVKQVYEIRHWHARHRGKVVQSDADVTELKGAEKPLLEVIFK